MNGVDVHGAESVDLLIDAHGTDFGGHGRANTSGDEDRHHDWREFFANGNADDAANGACKATFDEDWTGLERDDTADEEREDANHEKAGVADFEELLEDLLTLTPRERDVMARVVAGLLNKQVAGELGTSEAAVKVHRQHVMAKMGAGSLAALVRMADRLGIPTPPL